MGIIVLVALVALVGWAGCGACSPFLGLGLSLIGLGAFHHRFVVPDAAAPCEESDAARTEGI